MNSDNLDIVVVGAGISGINAAVRLQQLCPTQTFTILESKQSLGGTWDTFRYPGVRSDVDMWTYSFSFNPWNRDRNFGSGRMILDYLKDTAKKFHVEQYIQYQHQVISANWNSQLHHWELLVDTPIGTKNICCRFLLLCSGFYNHQQGYLPEFKNIEKYQGKFFHSQQWPTNLHIEDMVESYLALLKAKSNLVHKEIFNIGSKNLTVEEIALAVQKEINTDIPIEFSETNDLRSYRVDSSKIEKLIGFKPFRTINDAVRDLKNNFTKFSGSNPLNNPNYINILKMKELNLG